MRKAQTVKAGGPSCLSLRTQDLGRRFPCTPDVAVPCGARAPSGRSSSSSSFCPQVSGEFGRRLGCVSHSSTLLGINEDVRVDVSADPLSGETQCSLAHGHLLKGVKHTPTTSRKGTAGERLWQVHGIRFQTELYMKSIIIARRRLITLLWRLCAADRERRCLPCVAVCERHGSHQRRSPEFNARL